MTRNNLTLAAVDDADQARLDLEAAGVSVDAYEHDPHARQLHVTTPLPVALAQRLAMKAGFQLSYITFRRPLR